MEVRVQLRVSPRDWAPCLVVESLAARSQMLVVVAVAGVVVVVAAVALLSLECDRDLAFLRFALSSNYVFSILSLTHLPEPELQPDL